LTTSAEQLQDRPFLVGGQRRLHLVASGLGDQSTGGGLFVLRKHGVETLDRLSTTGLSVNSTHFVRALRSHESDARVELLVYDVHGIKRYLRIDDVGDVHDIIQDADAIVMVCSASNAVVWVSADGTIQERIDLPGDGDAWHVNSIHVSEGRLVASAFGRYTRWRQWAEPGTPRDEGIVFYLRTQEPIIRGLSLPHHPRRIADMWYVCNSGRNQVLQIDDKSGNIKREIPCGGFTRGLVFTDEYMIVGVSARRGDPAGSSAHIAIFDRKDWRLVEHRNLPVAEIYDLALVPSDFLTSLRTGFGTNPLRVQEQSQHSLFESIGIRDPVRLWAVGDALRPEDRVVTIAARLPSRVVSNRTFIVEAELTNEGSAFLVTAPPYPVYLTYKWLLTNSERVAEERPARRTPLPRSMPPQSSDTATMSILAPEVPGVYDLRITLVQELIAWFDDANQQSFPLARIVVNGSADDSGVTQFA
jgi:acetolactate synthase-1/2/3 large subunit